MAAAGTIDGITTVDGTVTVDGTAIATGKPNNGTMVGTIIRIDGMAGEK